MHIFSCFKCSPHFVVNDAVLPLVSCDDVVIFPFRFLDRIIKLLQLYAIHCSYDRVPIPVVISMVLNY